MRVCWAVTLLVLVQPSPASCATCTSTSVVPRVLALAHRHLRKSPSVRQPFAEISGSISFSPPVFPFPETVPNFVCHFKGSLHGVIQRHNGETRYADKKELAKGFSFGTDVRVILTGTASDPPLERWRSLGAQRRERIRDLRHLGVALVTIPNYSLFVDQPRWDDLHSLKRIAIVHEEFLREGMPAALHLNARTDRDWERWTEYITARPEVTHIAFEFATGAGWALRTQWHLGKLSRLAEKVGRPLHLVVRGGIKFLPALTRDLSDVTLLESSLFMKTKSRQRATLSAPGRVTWRSSPTKKRTR